MNILVNLHEEEVSRASPFLTCNCSWDKFGHERLPGEDAVESYSGPGNLDTK